MVEDAVAARITLRLDIDTSGQPIAGGGGDGYVKLVDEPDLVVEALVDDSAHGFGLAESLTVILTIGTGVASQLVAEALRAAVKAVIRRARSVRTGVEVDGSSANLAELIEKERQGFRKD